MRIPSFLLITLIFLAGCGVRLERPTSQTAIVPADLHQENDVRTIDIAYRFTGDDDGIRGLFRLAIAREFENCGYILHETPWTSKPGSHMKLQIDLHHDNQDWKGLLGIITVGLFPQMRDIQSTITVRAFTENATKVYDEKMVVTYFHWIPVLDFFGPPPVYPDVKDDEYAGMSEIVRIIVHRLRDDRLLATPEPRELP